MAGGLDSLRQLAQALHDAGAKVSLGWLPWDDGTAPTAEPLNVSLPAILYNFSADGLYGMDADTLDQAYTRYNASGGRQVRLFALQTDGTFPQSPLVPGAPHPLAFIPLTRADVLADAVPGGSATLTYVSTYRWLEPRHVATVGADWCAPTSAACRMRAIKAAFLSGGAVSISENVFSLASLWSPREAKLAARVAALGRFVNLITRSAFQFFTPSTSPSASVTPTVSVTATSTSTATGSATASASASSPASLLRGAKDASVTDYIGSRSLQGAESFSTALRDALSDLPWLPQVFTSDSDVAGAQFYAPCPTDLLSGIGDGISAQSAGPATVNCTVFLFANFGGTNKTGISANVSLAAAHSNSTLRPDDLLWFDLYHGAAVNNFSFVYEGYYRGSADPPPTPYVGNGTVTFDLLADDIAAFVAMPSQLISQPTWKAYLDFMRLNVSATNITDYADDHGCLQQTMSPVTPTQGYNSPPAGMVLVPGVAGYRYSVAASLPEVFTRLQAAPVISSGGCGLDVQYPWEASPSPAHSVTFDVPPYYVDVDLVTNQQFDDFLRDTGYRPADGRNFLRRWGSSPAQGDDSAFSAADPASPVVWVSFNDAAAYCASVGKRLPSDWEWQLAAQATTDGTDYRPVPWGGAEGANVTCDNSPGACPPVDMSRTPRPPDAVGTYPAGSSALGVHDMLGNVWQFTASTYCDALTCRIPIRGGSLYRPQDNGLNGNRRSRYFPTVSDAIHHAVLPVAGDVTSRFGYLGFRCVADTVLSKEALLRVTE